MNGTKDKSSKLVDIMIVRSNSIVNSPRVIKIASSLNKRYYVRVIGWNRAHLPTTDFQQFVADLDILEQKAPIGKFSLVLYMPLFWCYILGKLIKYSPRVVHACDLDTLPPVYLYKALFRRKVVFDVCDRYAMSKIPRERRILYSLVNRLEEFYASKVDCLINVSDRLEQTFHRKPKSSVIIMNCAEEYFSDYGGNENMKTGLKEKPPDDFSSKPSNSNNLRLVYTGNIIRGRGIEKIAEAIRGMINVSLLLAGKVIDYELLQEVSNLECVKYFGHLPLNKSLELEKSSDVMVILYDPYKINNLYAMPNKLFESMMFGIPLITNVSRDVIEKANCGLLVHYDDIEEIKNAVITLRDNREIRMRFGRNGRTAFENEFNWHKMEQVLYGTYETLLIS